MSSRLSDKNNKKLQQKNEKILEELSKLPGNNHCCDCGATGPRWASFNIGCFLCIKCGGIHRKMGTHISKVKSISLDTWTPEQIQSMQEWGNEKVNQHYLPNGETRKIPSDPIGMEQYIRDKYEHQAFRRGSNNSRQNSTRDEVTDSHPTTFNTMHARASNALIKLRDMGFTNTELNKRILSQTQMDVNSAIEILCNLPDEEPNQLKQLQAMGFDNAAKCGAALRKSGGDLDKAVELLVQDRELRKAQAERNIPSRSSRSGTKSSDPLPQPPRQENKSKQDIFGSATGDDQDDDFGDFHTTTTTAEESATSSKDYIMSLFGNGSSQATSTSAPSNAFNMGNSFAQPTQSSNPLDGLSFAPAPTPVNAQANQSFNNNNSQQFSNSLGFGGNNNQSFNFNNTQSLNNQNYSTNTFNGNNQSFGSANQTGFNQSFNNDSFNNNQTSSFSPPGYNQSGSFSNQSSFQSQQVSNNNNMHQLESSMAKMDPFGDLGSLAKKTYTTTSPPKTSTSSFNANSSNSNGASNVNTTTTPPKKVNVDDLLDLLN